jgi:hypothetical protein
MSYEKPLPTITPANRPFWDSVKAHKMQLPKCKQCNKFHAPPREFCPHCLSEEFEWKAVSGRGEVLSFAVMHQPYTKAFAKDVPYNYAVVQLDEGPRLVSNVLGPHEQIRVGEKVEVVYDDVTPEITLHRFKRV